MSYTKTINVDINWLGVIDGHTVEEAILYLQTLNKNYRLDAYLDGGDTHGVEIATRLCYDVPMTDAEILAYLEKDYARKIADRERGKQYYIDRGQLDRVPQSEMLILELQQKLADVRILYGEE